MGGSGMAIMKKPLFLQQKGFTICSQLRKRFSSKWPTSHTFRETEHPKLDIIFSKLVSRRCHFRLFWYICYINATVKPPITGTSCKRTPPVNRHQIVVLAILSLKPCIFDLPSTDASHKWMPTPIECEDIYFLIVVKE